MSDPNAPKLISTSKTSSISINPEDLGPPASRTILSIVPQFENRLTSNEQILADRTPRQFVVAARLSKTPSTTGEENQIKGDFDREDGASYLVAPPGRSAIRVETLTGNFDFKTNRAQELSMIEFKCTASTHLDARTTFMATVYPALDHLSYSYNVPLFVTVIRVFDATHQAAHIGVTSPYRRHMTGDSLNELFLEMRPIYAMYREAKNSTSDFYRFLCLYKIMEGLLGSMRSAASKTARKAGVTLGNQRLCVPDDVVAPSDLSSHVGKPIKEFFDQVLTKRFRHAVAHLQTKGRILDVSAPAELEQFAGLALVTDLCTRELIAEHERILGQLKTSGV